MDHSERNSPNNPEERFRYLWEKYTSKLSSRKELDELFRLLSDPKLEELSRSLIESELSKPLSDQELMDEAFDREHWMDRLAAIKESADHNKEKANRNIESDSDIKHIPLFRRTWTRYAAAAVFVGLGAGIYFALKPKPGAQSEIATTQANKTNDVNPGGNKAILTLGNGSKIMLDSASNGTLAKQGNSNVIKTDSGRLAYNVLHEKLTDVVYNILSTPRAGQYQLTLPDGTKVWLDAASSIKYPTAFTGKTRKVEVTGQVYFEVVHNEHQPFIVVSNHIEMTDIGTSFNVNMYGDEPEEKVTLIEGAISVKTNNEKEELFLKPGEQATANHDDNLKLKSGIDMSVVMAWKNGRFQLGSIDFQTLMRQLSRWYDIDIIYEGTVPDKKFGGTINRSVNLSTILEVMKDYGIETKLENKKLTIL